LKKEKEEYFETNYGKYETQEEYERKLNLKGMQMILYE
jgi:hypothetical protein